MMGLDLIRCEAEVGRCTETVGCEQFNYPLRCKKIAFKQAMWRPDSTPKTNDFLTQSQQYHDGHAVQAPSSTTIGWQLFPRCWHCARIETHVTSDVALTTKYHVERHRKVHDDHSDMCIPTSTRYSMWNRAILWYRVWKRKCSCFQDWYIHFWRIQIDLFDAAEPLFSSSGARMPLGLWRLPLLSYLFMLMWLVSASFHAGGRQSVSCWLCSYFLNPAWLF